MDAKFFNSGSVETVRDWQPRLLKIAVGREIRAWRQRAGMTGRDLAESAGISVGMLSKVENGIISPSLEKLHALSSALNISPAELFKASSVRQPVFTKAAPPDGGREEPKDSGSPVIKGTIAVDRRIVTFTEAPTATQLETQAGKKFVFMLSGEVVYRYGRDQFRLSPGDSLSFDADFIHGPVKFARLPVTYISVVASLQGR